MTSTKYKYMKILSVMFLGLFVTQTLAFDNQAVKQQNCAELLSKEAKEKIVKQYKNWRILQKEDLVSDDQTLWDKYRHGECPGVITGHFDTSGKTSYAILIISQPPADRKRTKLLLLTMSVTGNYRIQLLYAEDGVTNFPAIHKEPPGPYSDFYDQKNTIETKTDVIIYEHIEASALAFYYKNGKYRHLLISD